MKTFIRYALKQLLVLLVSASVAFAQTPPAQRSAAAAQPELDQMLAPIALYPDSLLSQIFMASTYPLEVVEAARWSRANPGLKGEEAVNAVEQRDWDARLGDVFIAQEPQVMETVQSLRQKAYAAGNLRSNEQAYVVQQGEALAIEPATPQVVYVPYYDPRVAYGSWWWPAYPPVYWAPWPGYYVYPGFAFAWGGGIRVGSGFFFSSCDGRAGRADGRGNFSPNPAVVRSEVRPEPGVSRPPVAAPQVHAVPSGVPRVQNPAPQPAPHNPQAQGFAGRGQAGNRPGPSVTRGHGEGHNR